MKKKIKLIIFPGNFLPHIGGLETHVNEFVKNLSKYKYYKITIFTPNILNVSEKEIIYKNVEVIRYPAFFLVNNFPFPKIWSIKFWKIYLDLYKQNFDIVMTRTMFFTNTTLGTIFAKIRIKKKKLIHVEHASDYSKLDSNIKSFFNKFYMHTLGNLTILLSDKIVSVSIASKMFLNLNFLVKNKKITVIRRGFNYEICEKIEPNLKLKKKYNSKKIITFVGRLIDGKGVQDVLSALKEISEDYIFLIIGDGKYKKKLLKLIKIYNLEQKIIFLGKLEHKEVISILKISDLFVNPSYTEGLPTTVLDAFFSGTKILATNVGGTYEILENYWNTSRYKLVKEKNIKEIKNKIIQLLKVNKEVDLKLIKKIQKKFDWIEHTKKYDEMLRNL